MGVSDLPEHVRRNRVYWEGLAQTYEASGRHNWEQAEPHWGIWHMAEAELHMFPDELADLATIELGCGTAYVSAWLARRGARPTGIDNSPTQLDHARRFQREFGSISRLSSAMPNRRPCPMRASILRSRSTVQASGAICIDGFRKRPACSAGEAVFISW